MYSINKYIFLKIRHKLVTFGLNLNEHKAYYVFNFNFYLNNFVFLDCLDENYKTDKDGFQKVYVTLVLHFFLSFIISLHGVLEYLLGEINPQVSMKYIILSLTLQCIIIIIYNIYNNDGFKSCYFILYIVLLSINCIKLVSIKV